jgi:hypothetical protein
MANVDHASLTGSDLHEPKGADAAPVGSLYIANGAGSGSWSTRQFFLTAYIADVSTAGQIYVVSPVAGTVSKIYTALNGAIGTADAVITPKIGGAAITAGAVTIAYSSSAAGDVDSSTPSAANTVTAGQAIEIETNGASTNTVPIMITVVIDRAA